jgi:hypothetical protein
MLRIAAVSLLVRAAIVAIVLTAVSSCASSTPTIKLTPPASAAPPASPPTVSPRPTATAAACDTSGWRSAPISVTRQAAAPAVPVITTIKAAAHPECGYDRLVLGITGPMPSYDIRYVTQVTADPSGKPITLAGRSYLLITLRPAQGHAEGGAPTIVGFPQSLGYPVLRSYALVGDFEGVLTLAIGLDRAPSIRVGELPGRWYIDVRT